MTKERFSKKQLASFVWEEIYRLELKHGFKSYNGWSQVDNKGEDINREYGKYDCLIMLTNEFDLIPT